MMILRFAMMYLPFLTNWFRFGTGSRSARSALSNEATGLNAWITANISPLTTAVAPIVVVLIITTAGVFLTTVTSSRACIFSCCFSTFCMSKS